MCFYTQLMYHTGYENNEAEMMGQGLFTTLLMIGVITGCSSTTPADYSDAAFKQYSLRCVARGIPENTQEHTDCVYNKYESAHKGQIRVEKKMSILFADKNKSAIQEQEAEE